MPAKNSLKQFIPESYYHLYNRGVEKRHIFVDDQDYAVFLSYVKNYLLPKDTRRLQKILANPQTGWREKDQAIKLLRMNNFAQTLTLHAYCLMPNHFHLLVKQTEAPTIDRFMNSLCTRYSMYFNRKHKRVGTLFQGVYKAVPVISDEQLLHLSRYIHRNPHSLASQGEALRSYAYSSVRDYLKLRKTEWVRVDTMLSYFSSTSNNSYESFVDGVSDDERHQEIVTSVAIDLDAD